MRPTFPLLVTFLLLYAALFIGSVRPCEAGAKPDILKILDDIEASYGKLSSYTATFLKQERVDGELLPEETIRFKFKKPFKVYMGWLKGTPHGGREALYVAGRYDNKIVGHEGGILGIVTLHMDPKGGTAMKGNRHPITDSGIGRLIEIVTQNGRRAIKNGEGKFDIAGEETVFGRQAYVIKAELPEEKEKGYYARSIKIWVDREAGLPIRILIYGWEGELLESYGYKDLKVNPGIPDDEFDENYKGYGF